MEFYLGAFTSEWEQRRAAILHERALGGRRNEIEDELRNRLKAARSSGGGGVGGSRSRSRSMSNRRASEGGASRSMEARLSNVANGSQSAVVKMASYGGGARVAAMLNYVSRAGELKVENENGEKLQGPEKLSQVRSEWDHLFQNRTESRDIGAFSVDAGMPASGVEAHEHIRDILTSGFGDRRYIYSAERREDGSLQVEGYVVLRSGQGERLSADAKAASIVQERYNESAKASEAPARFTFRGHGNGVDYGTAKIRDMIEKNGSVRDEQGRQFYDAKGAGDLVQKEWRQELHSRKSRDVMHVIMSARAGTDAGAFEGAVRDFLSSQFAGHRYVFAMHDPANDPKEAGEGGKRPHVHAHAIVTMRSDAGDRIETSPHTFRQWREVMAEKARSHGIAMEMTDRREFAAAPAFTHKQVRPVSHDGRTEYAGTSEAAQKRYDAKRSGRRMAARSRQSRQYAVKAQDTWHKIAVNAPDTQVRAFASAQKAYLETADRGVSRAEYVSDRNSTMVEISNIIQEASDMKQQTRKEFEAYEKRVETALTKLNDEATQEDKKDIQEVTSLAREVVGYRRELLERREQREAPSETSKQPVSTDTTDSNPKERQAQTDHRAQDPASREPQDASSPAEAGRQKQDRTNRDRQAQQNARSEASKSQLTRLQELEREQMQKRERERDDRER